MLRCKVERKTRNLTQHTVATAAGIPQPFVSLIERGRLVPTAAQLERLSAALGVPAGELLKDVVPFHEQRP